MLDFTPIENDIILNSFFKKNRSFSFDLQTFNFYDTKVVGQLNWEGLDKDKICDRLKSYQRLLNLDISLSDARKLLERPVFAASQEGEQSKASHFDSALAIASISQEEFVKASNLDPDKAREIHRKARQTPAGSMVILATAMQFGSPRVANMLGDNTAQVRENFQSLPSYQELFGSLDYLQCDPCQSIFSPSAYFIDLMRLVDQYITEPNKITEANKLSTRRPDLEQIPLTCDNTNDTVPYTQIVSEVLAERLKKELHGKDIFQYLATEAKYPHNLPFNFYLEQIRLCCGHLNTSLADIYQTFHPQDPYNSVWAREYLGLSLEEYNLIIKANTRDLSDRYGVNISPTNFGGLNKKETFLKQTGLSWQELKDLLEQNLSSEEIKSGIPHQFYINKKLSDKKYLNLNNKGEIENLSLDALDRIDRFLRLARKLGWSFADLDWVLTSIEAEDINEESIKKIAKIKLIQAKTKLPLDVLCSFWYNMKTIGKEDKQNLPQDLFNRVFNNHCILQGRSNYNPHQSHPYVKIKHDLLAALQLSDQDLTDIVEGIGETPKEFSLELSSFSLLFRISQILKLIRLKLDEYKLLLQFLNKPIELRDNLELDSLIEIWELASWIKESGFSIYELDYIINGNVHPSVDVFLPKDKMDAFIKSLREKIKLNNDSSDADKARLNEEIAIHFGMKPRLFSILAQLAAQIIEIDDKADYIKLLLNQPNKDIKISEFLSLISRVRLFVNKLGLTEEELQSIIEHPGAYNITGLAKFKIYLVLSNFVPKIENLAKLLEILSTVIDNCPDQVKNVFESIRGFIKNHYDEFKDIEFPISISDVLHFIVFKVLSLIPEVKEFIDSLRISFVNIKDLVDFRKKLVPLFNQFQQESVEYFESQTVENLARITGWKKQEIENVNKHITSNSLKSVKNTKTLNDIKIEKTSEDWKDKLIIAVNSFEKGGEGSFHNSIQGLLKLKQCFDLCANLGCDIDWLWNLCELLQNKLAANNWDDYLKEANSAIALVKAKYNDENWMKVFSKLNGTLEERKCKILTDFALWKLGMENPRQLSEHLLLDVEMTSCACNSRIQLAILSLQTYLQRCRMGIEPEITKVEIPTVWWEWIMNYRIWEANRKVFLYPENYIDPSLRKNASPIFKELQDELLQSEITTETVEAAYRNYFDKFAELARLQIVDGCRYSVQTPKSAQPVDTLFIFAKTITQPHTFYYRHCENPEAKKPLWGYWEKIDLQINSDYLAPVYAFNRLFIFWVETVETSEVNKPKEQTKTKEESDQKEKTKTKKESDQIEKKMRLTIKYSFFTPSQKWVSPQTLCTKKNQFSEPLEQYKSELWKHIYPIIFKDSSCEKILAFLGGLPALTPNNFKTEKKKYEDCFEQLNILTEDLLISPPAQTTKFSYQDLPENFLYQYQKSNVTLAPIKGDNVTLASIKRDDNQQNLISLEFIVQLKHEGFIVQDQSRAFLSPTEKPFTLTRLTTSTIQQFSRTLFAQGLDGLLSLKSQRIYEPGFLDVAPSNTLDFDGAYGEYFWEIFFHIPFLIASTLNAHQHYNEARQWYQYIFNPTQPQLPKPISYWPLNEGDGTHIGDQVGNIDGTVKGKADWPIATDFPGSADRKVLQFDGNSNYVELNTLSRLKLKDGDFTIQAWFKLEDFGLFYSPILSMELDAQTNTYLHLGIGSKKVFMAFKSGDPDFPSIDFQKGIWYNITWRYNKYTEVKAIFVNGKLQGSSKGNTFETVRQEVRIGYFYTDQQPSYFKGQIANVRIWNVALSDEDIIDSFESVNQSKSHFWRFLPFRGNTPEKLTEILTNQAAIQAYKENPFDPHAIARLRIGAYEKAVVMKYIDNLLNWGDTLFAQDSWESITQATTLYLLAYDLLGSKPKNVGKPPAPEPKTFAQIKAGAKGDISDFLIDLENRPEYQEFIKQFGDAVPFNALDAYFCVSENQQFAQYWDRVEDRLFKIRHCQNIKGIERQLALFQPPIDPMQLVRQAAAADGSIALSLPDTVPHYRFSYLLERAKGMAATVIQLGSTLLNTLEKKDAEELALLRATQESALLQLITKTKEKQIEEAEASLTSLQRSLEAARDRSQYYQKLIDEGWNAGEIATVALMGAALIPQIEATAIRAEAIPAYLLPNIYGMADGGMQFGDAVNMGATTLDGVAGVLNQSASLSSTVAQFQRRQEEWEFQEKMAEWDVKQIEEQLKAAQVRVEMSKAELDIHYKSIEHSRQVEEFFKDKFTNKELYQWMVGRLSSLYFQTYKIALEMAYSAQKAYQYELNKDDSYLQPTYWDSNKKGLLAGESLMLGLNQLEKAYLDGSDRRLEIEKIISLRQLLHDDNEFNNSKEKGEWKFSFCQKDFDEDFPDHYCRQIKTISVTIPAVVGPYQTIKATLTQTSNTILIKSNQDAVNWLNNPQRDINNPPDSSILRQNWHTNQKIAISKGVNDSGLFVLNFQDERYLPFEGTGAISSWTLKMPKANNSTIDFNSITDVIITLNYTALDGG